MIVTLASMVVIANGILFSRHGSTVALAQSTPGVAYDSVMKDITAAKPALRSSDFAADARDARRPHQYCSPSLTRRYMTTQHERLDEPCRPGSTIIDCTTRTATLLNPIDKTYSVVSLDQTYDDGIVGMAAAVASSRLNSTTTIRRQNLGSKDIDGVVTDAFSTYDAMSITSALLQLETTDEWTYYFSRQALPALACIDIAAPWLGSNGHPDWYEPELQAFRALQHVKERKTNLHVAESGPQLPGWRIPLFAVGTHAQHQDNAHYETYFVEVESGNVRPIRDDDLVFRIPPGYKKAPVEPPSILMTTP